MPAWTLRIEELLRPPSGPARRPEARQLRDWALVLLAAGLGYGAVMGTFGGVGGDRLLQVVFSAVKVPVLLLVTFGVSLPSFLVLNTLLGVRDDLREVLGALVSTQAGLTIILLSLAPYTAFFYASSDDYGYALLFNGAMFATASASAQWILWQRYRPLIARRPRHRTLLRVWLLIYVFVGIQTAWVLRPFIGSPNMPVQFFRAEAWGNAYEVVAGLIWGALTK